MLLRIHIIHNNFPSSYRYFLSRQASVYGIPLRYSSFDHTSFHPMHSPSFSLFFLPFFNLAFSMVLIRMPFELHVHSILLTHIWYIYIHSDAASHWGLGPANRLLTSCPLLQTKVKNHPALSNQPHFGFGTDSIRSRKLLPHPGSNERHTVVRVQNLFPKTHAKYSYKIGVR